MAVLRSGHKNAINLQGFPFWLQRFGSGCSWSSMFDGNTSCVTTRYTRGVRLGSKSGQIGTQWDKSGILFRSGSVKKSQNCPIVWESDQVWGKPDIPVVGSAARIKTMVVWLGSDLIQLVPSESNLVNHLVNTFGSRLAKIYYPAV